MTKTIVFDIGNVVWRYQPYLKRLLTVFAQLNHQTYDEFYPSYLNHYVSLEINTQSLQDWVNHLPNTDYPQYLQALDSIYNTPEFDSFYHSEVISLIAQLRQRVSVAYLSNAENYLYPYIHQKIAPLFDFGYCSWQLGCRKPDPEIYQQLLSRHSLISSQTVFVDDKPRNVHAAQALGINGIVFESHSQLVADLQKFLLD